MGDRVTQGCRFSEGKQGVLLSPEQEELTHPEGGFSEVSNSILTQHPAMAGRDPAGTCALSTQPLSYSAQAMSQHTCGQL